MKLQLPELSKRTKLALIGMLFLIIAGLVAQNIKDQAAPAAVEAGPAEPAK
jgi:hypothetical protein